MNALAVRLIAVGVACLALFAAVQYVRALQADLSTARLDAQTAKQGNTDRDATIKVLRENERANQLARAKLEGERNGIRQTLAEREHTFRRLLDENKDVREWALAAVPGPVIGLRFHGPFTGVQAYREARAGSDALHPAGRIDPK